MSVVAAVAAALLMLLSGPATSTPARLASIARQPDAAPQQPRSPARLLAAAGVLVVAMALIRGTVGLLIATLLAAAVAVAKPRIRPSRVAVDDVPVVVELLAGCLDAGLTFPDALLVASRVAAGELATICHGTAGALRAGATADEAWHGWLADPALAAVARSVIRTARSGAAVADDLRRTAARLRARRRSARERKVRQASVWLVVPLGTCFLPAFVLVAVVPIVVGLIPALHR